MSGNVDPESGLWQRIRVWSDAMPWLALGRCLRPATSPTLLALAALAFWLGSGGTRLIDAYLPAPARLPVTAQLPAPAQLPVPAAVRPEPDAPRAAAPGLRWIEGLWRTAPDLADAADYAAGPALILGDPSLWGRSLLGRLLRQAWLLLVWTVPAALIVRQGMLAVAGRQAMGVLAGLSLAGGRLPALLLVVLLPILAATSAGLFFLIPGWIWHIPWAGPWLAEAIAVIAVPLAIAAGLLAFGSLFAVPLGWAAVMAEPQGDAFDAVSRGYEYTFRRPLQLAFYLLLGWLISRVAGALAVGIAVAAGTIAQRFLSLATGQIDPLTVAPALLASLPAVFAIVLFWSLVGGIYLLLRRDANGQEVEDLWERPPAAAEPIPPLP